ncbi:MAG: periplasmic heavy metal sensor [Acidobacteria bacterium]|nr:MAG: periplasmic heavy metal sensor [Acidobacteriota bacterium]
MKRRAYVYFTLIFVLGIVIGAAGMYSYGWYTGHWHRGFSRRQVIDYLQKELDLSQSQTQQLRQIIRNMDQKESELRDQIAPQFQAIREETRAETRKILNAQQLEKFNEMVKRWDANRKKAVRQPPSPPSK